MGNGVRSGKGFRGRRRDYTPNGEFSPISPIYKGKSDESERRKSILLLPYSLFFPFGRGRNELLDTATVGGIFDQGFETFLPGFGLFGAHDPMADGSLVGRGLCLKKFVGFRVGF